MSEHVPFPESQTDYLPLCENTVQIVPDHRGIVTPVDGLVRPYAFEVQELGIAMTAHVLSLNDQTERVKTPLSALAGIRFMGVSTDPLMGGQRYPVASLHYYNRDQHGDLEAMRRVILLQGVAYGIHPDHDGRAPGWYFTGLQLGLQDPDTLEYTRSAAEDMRMVDISLACVVGGPVGDPHDQKFRHLQNIPD